MAVEQGSGHYDMCASAPTHQSNGSITSKADRAVSVHTGRINRDLCVDGQRTTVDVVLRLDSYNASRVRPDLTHSRMVEESRSVSSGRFRDSQCQPCVIRLSIGKYHATS